MTDFNMDNDLFSMAYFCKNFKAESPCAKMSAATEGISCSSCANWGSRGCMKDAFDSLSSDIDYI